MCCTVPSSLTHTHWKRRGTVFLSWQAALCITWQSIGVSRSVRSWHLHLSLPSQPLGAKQGLRLNRWWLCQEREWKGKFQTAVLKNKGGKHHSAQKCVRNASCVIFAWKTWSGYFKRIKISARNYLKDNFTSQCWKNVWFQIRYIQYFK